MNEECLICKAPLTYLEADMLMECEICHKKENSKTRCVNRHYVCNECHTQGLDRIIELCMTSASRDPIAIIEQMMALPTCLAVTTPLSSTVATDVSLLLHLMVAGVLDVSSMTTVASMG